MVAESSKKKAFIEDLKQRGISDAKVLEAFLKVPREKFVLPEDAPYAYADRPLPILSGQTISQPLMVAIMTQALQVKRGQKILEVGTGSGYQAAILRELTDQVYSIEILPELFEFSKKNLNSAGYTDLHLKCGSGYEGWLEFAPFDGIVVTAAAPEVPENLKEQLKEGGRLVIPLERALGYQTLYLIQRLRKEKFRSEPLYDVRFVPLVKKAEAGNS